VSGCGCKLEDDGQLSAVCEEHVQRVTTPNTPVMRDGEIVGHVRMAKMPTHLGKSPLLIPGDQPRFANRAERRAIARSKGRHHR
jgi:hypothetical protein